jgi:tRNA(fMet)-specific endonuclease VapC
MAQTLLDTDILSELLKQKDPNVVRKAAVYLHLHGQFAFSALTRYEILRGLFEKNASAQMARFSIFCQQSLVLPLSDAVLDRAAELWATAGLFGPTPHGCRSADRGHGSRKPSSFGNRKLRALSLGPRTRHSRLAAAVRAGIIRRTCREQRGNGA